MPTTKPYNATIIEEEILQFWKENKIYEKAKAKNKGKQKFYFLDGPPYTSGKVHLGTAWNKALKDCILRYKRMRSFDVWDRAGYDMHGLPTEHAVEKKLSLKSKKDIEKLGVANFVRACRELSIENLNSMSEDFLRIGVWMDFENAYMSASNDYMEGEWWLIKKAYEHKRLYEAERTMHWCSRCSTSLAKHELEYRRVTDDSVFVKLKVVGKNEYLIIWTTTPWTLPFNLGVMANPELDYIRADVDDEVWIVAKLLADYIIGDVAEKKYSVIEDVKGSELEGIKYATPFNNEIKKIEELKQRHPKIHTVVLSAEYVNTESGSGIVHMAPGCGPEDYEVGHRNNIPPVNTLTESGIFDEESGVFSGLRAKKDDKKIIEELEKRNVLIAQKKFEHDYPCCWRCKHQVIFRTTNQWFFKIEDIKERMRELNKDIYWVPDFAGSRNFDHWLSNLRDNGITRQRYWGTPLPIWKCKDCSDYVIIESVEKLKMVAATEVPEDLHKPWIDDVKIKCECGSLKERIPDVLDVWIDAGSASWNCLGYPRSKELFEQLYPADFILEGIDQIRGWFNLLFVASMVAIGKPSFRAVYMHGFINDALGRKMSKSLGNYILPEEVIAKYGADTMRYYMIGGASPGLDLNYNLADMKVKHKNLEVLWNLHKFVIELKQELKDSKTNNQIDLENMDAEERYILSRLNSTIKNVTGLFEQYSLNDVPKEIECLFLELSRTYIQLVREKSAGTDDDKRVVLSTAFNVLASTLKIFAPVAPFICESMHQNLKEHFELKEQSIHLYDWPVPEERFINEELEKNMGIVQDVIQGGLAIRQKINLGVRWPLKELVVVTKDSDVQKSVNNLKTVIQKQINVKEVLVKEFMHGLKHKVKADYEKIGPEFGNLVPRIITHLTVNSPETIIRHIEKDGKYTFKEEGKEIIILKEHLIISKEVPHPYEEASFSKGFVYVSKEMTEELEAEGFAREIMRRVQALRKQAGLKKSQSVSVVIKTDEDSCKMLAKWDSQIKSKVGAEKIKISKTNPAKKYMMHTKEEIKGRTFEIYVEIL